MAHAGTDASKTGFNILVVDSDPDFLNASCRAIARNGHRAWGARDLIAAMSFLTDQTPHAILIELALLESDGSDPLADIRVHAPVAPIVLTSIGSADGRFDMYTKSHTIYGHHNKQRGSEGLLLWINSALATVRRSLLGGVDRSGESASETAEADQPG